MSATIRNVTHGTIRSQLAALPRPVWILLAGTLINRFGTFVMPMLALYLTGRGFSISRTGLAVGAYGVGHVIASIGGGQLADRIGRRNTIAVSMFSSAAAMLVLSQARSYESIVALTIVAGAAAELYRPASHALIGDVVDPSQRVIAFGAYRWAVNLGCAAGPATAGFLANRSFFYVFAGDAVTSCLYGFIALGFLPHGLRSASPEDTFGEALKSARRQPRFLAFLAASMLAAAVDCQMGSTVALQVRSLGFSPALYGALISINGILIVLFELLITAKAQRYRPQPVIAFGFALGGIGFALTAFARTAPALAATVVIWTVGEMISSPMTGAYVTQLAPDRFRGRYMGLFVGTWSVGMIAGPIVGTILFERSPMLVWMTCGAVGLVAAALALWTPRAARDATAAATTEAST